MPNIFKMTPEMTSLLSSSAQEETPLGILDESPPTNALSQSQVNLNTVNQIPSTNDPFSISKNRINGDVRAVGLFERLNGKKNNVDLVRPDPHIFDTPTGPTTEAEDLVLAGKEDFGRLAAGQVSNEPPLAPMRKGRTMPGLGMDFSVGMYLLTNGFCVCMGYRAHSWTRGAFGQFLRFVHRSCCCSIDLEEPC